MALHFSQASRTAKLGAITVNDQMLRALPQTDVEGFDSRRSRKAEVRIEHDSE
jgi:hypothetical protein